MKLNKKTQIGIFFLLSILLVASVSAIGVGFSRNIEVAPGESVQKILSLQNLPAGNGKLIFKGTIPEGSDIVSFVDGDEYTIDDGELAQAAILITAPEGASLGDTYTIKILFSTSQAPGQDSGETVQFNEGTGITFKVEIASQSDTGSNIPPEGDNPGIWYVWVLVVIILIIVVYFIAKRKK